jgi:hypothetical protein
MLPTTDDRVEVTRRAAVDVPQQMVLHFDVSGAPAITVYDDRPILVPRALSVFLSLQPNGRWRVLAARLHGEYPHSNRGTSVSYDPDGEGTAYIWPVHTPVWLAQYVMRLPEVTGLPE